MAIKELAKIQQIVDAKRRTASRNAVEVVFGHEVGNVSGKGL